MPRSPFCMMAAPCACACVKGRRAGGPTAHGSGVSRFGLRAFDEAEQVAAVTVRHHYVQRLLRLVPEVVQIRHDVRVLQRREHVGLLVELEALCSGEGGGAVRLGLGDIVREREWTWWAHTGR